MFTTSWEILKSCRLQRGAGTIIGIVCDDDNDNETMTMMMRVTGMYETGRHKERILLLCRPPPLVLCKTLQLAKTLGNTSETRVVLQLKNNNKLQYYNVTLDSNSNIMMLSEGSCHSCPAFKTKSIEILLVRALGWAGALECGC